MMPGHHLALLLWLAAGQTAQPQWLADYPEAMKKAEELNRPLIVVVGFGHEGWKNVLQQPWPEPRLRQLLATKCVCLYLDRNDARARDYANRFDQGGSTLVVVSDRSRQNQAFRRSGPVSGGELLGVIEVQTGTSIVRSSSYYEPPASNPVNYPLNPVFNPGFGVPGAGCST